MVDIHYGTAEIRRGKKKKETKKERKEKPQDGNIMSASATQDGHNKESTYLRQGMTETVSSATSG